jgi:hypothetical protein
MNKQEFIESKVRLLYAVNKQLEVKNISDSEKFGLIKLIEILNGYSFDNRLQKKGLLSHTIVDSLDIDYSIGELFLKFDNDI